MARLLKFHGFASLHVQVAITVIVKWQRLVGCLLGQLFAFVTLEDLSHHIKRFIAFFQILVIISCQASIFLHFFSSIA